jgi:hypothetical protein
MNTTTQNETLSLMGRNDIMRAIALIAQHGPVVVNEIKRELELEGLDAEEVRRAAHALSLSIGKV